MTNPILLTLCALLLIAYVFDLTARKTRVPSVILLMLLGWLAHRVADAFGVAIPNLAELLPLFGTVGLILIVLEGALELEVTREKFPLIIKAFVSAAASLLALSIALGAVFHLVLNCGWQAGIANAIPLAVISSAVAIPSAAFFPQRHREFVVYESSISDILGVLAFNFITLNDEFSYGSVFEFGAELLLMIAVSFVASLGLAVLLGKINHHVKYLPITIAVVLVYAVAKQFHLPSLLFILLFGLFLGNLERIRGVSSLRIAALDVLDAEIERFKEIAAELTFLIRALFFLLFGFVIESAELVDATVLAWSGGIVVGIYALRAIILATMRLPQTPLLAIAPRGLITILLFYGIPEVLRINVVHRSLIIQVIVLCAIVMMVGTMNKKSSQIGTVID